MGKRARKITFRGRLIKLISLVVTKLATWQGHLIATEKKR